MRATIVYFIHIPRTGGTFLAHHLRCCASLELVLYAHDGFYVQRLAQLAASGRRVVTVVMLRDPVEHTRSLHDIAARDPAHHLHGLATRVGPAEYARVRPGGVREFFTHHFCQFTETLGEAVDTLCRIDYVLDTAQLTTQANGMLAQLGETYRLPERDLPSVKAPVTDEEVAYIKREREGDYRLIEALAALGKANIRLEH